MRKNHLRWRIRERKRGRVDIPWNIQRWPLLSPLSSRPWDICKAWIISSALSLSSFSPIIKSMMLCWEAKNCHQYFSIAEAASARNPSRHCRHHAVLSPGEIPVKKALGSLWQKGEVHCMDGSEICKRGKSDTEEYARCFRQIRTLTGINLRGQLWPAGASWVMGDY